MRLADTPQTNAEGARASARRTQIEKTIAPAHARLATEDREADVRKEAADALVLVAKR